LKEYEDGTTNIIQEKNEKDKLHQDFNEKLPRSNIYQRDKQKDLIKIRIMSNRMINQVPFAPNFDVLFIHIHGGGYISMSSKSHQCYTRL
jgi:hypothetical protein